MEQFLMSAVEFIVPLAIGLVLILFGRRVFWLLAGLVFAIGGLFLAAVLLTPAALATIWDMITGTVTVGRDFTSEPFPPLAIIGAVVGGAIGILVTIRYPQIAGAVVGFALGAFFLALTCDLFAIVLPEPVRRTLIILVGTSVAAIAYRQPAQTMIILTTMLGSQALLDATRLDLNSALSAFLWLFSMLVGIIYQTGVWRTEQRKQTERRAATISSAPGTP